MHATVLIEPRVARLSKFRDMEAQARNLVGPEQDRLLVFLAIELLNLWQSFCRTYALYAGAGLRSASNDYWAASVPGVSTDTKEEVRRLLVSCHGKNAKRPTNPMDEPTWRDLAILKRCCETLNTGAVQSVNLAIGLPGSFRRELHHARNFAAHKGEDTHRKLQSVSLQRGLVPTKGLSLMMATASSGSGTVTLEWITEMEDAITIMAG